MLDLHSGVNNMSTTETVFAFGADDYTPPSNVPKGTPRDLAYQSTYHMWH